MYTWKDGANGRTYEHLGANIQKSIKIDKGTLEIIESCSGRSFSEKIRNMAADYKKLKVKI